MYCQRGKSSAASLLFRWLWHASLDARIAHFRAVGRPDRCNPIATPLGSQECAVATSRLTCRPTRTRNIELPPCGACCMPLASSVKPHAQIPRRRCAGVVRRPDVSRPLLALALGRCLLGSGGLLVGAPSSAADVARSSYTFDCRSRRRCMGTSCFEHFPRPKMTPDGNSSIRFNRSAQRRRPEAAPGLQR